MASLVKVGNSYLSRGYARTAVAHKKALAAPMIGCKMVSDPLIGYVGHKPATMAAAMRERRACQYAAAMARKTLGADLNALTAIWNEETSTVFFMAGNRLYSRYVIPEHVMAFDVDNSLLCLPEPETAPAPCTQTASMFDDSAKPAVDWDAILGAVEDDLLVFAMETGLEQFRRAA
jgi:hypothetical protein